MTGNILKFIACLTMLCDHVGAAMKIYGVGTHDAADTLRIIGRLSFPIFAFLIAEGYKHTRNVSKYAFRLFIFGIISEIPYNLCFHGTRIYSGLNVMFTLFTALMAIAFSDMCLKYAQKEYRFLFIIPVVAACIIAGKTKMDYGYFGVLLVFMLYLIDGDDIKRRFLIIPALLVFASREYIKGYFNEITVSDWGKNQLFSFLTFIPLFMYNGKQGLKIKSRFLRKLVQYAFYAFYPVHLLVLYFLFTNMRK